MAVDAQERASSYLEHQCVTHDSNGLAFHYRGNGAAITGRYGETVQQHVQLVSVYAPPDDLVVVMQVVVDVFQQLPVSLLRFQAHVLLFPVRWPERQGGALTWGRAIGFIVIPGRR